jgi:prepilin-type N-terminal cleavage/methylation domain-containing protein
MGPPIAEERAETMRPRPGLTLIELMITVTLVGVLLYIGGSTLRVNETDSTRRAAYDVVDVFRRARYVAARQNTAVVVTVDPYSTTLPDGTVTRGRVEARLASTTNCPGTTPSGDPFDNLDLGSYSGADGSDEPGLVVVTPSDLVADGFCIRPNGRIIDNRTGSPIRPAGLSATDLAGKADLWIQYNPAPGGRVDGAGNLLVPRMQVEVPFNGLVRVPQ